VAKRSASITPDQTVSLQGDAGREVADNLTKLSAGMITPDKLGPAYSIRADGALCVRVDAETAALLPWRQK
jgi:hypothetical protein